MKLMSTFLCIASAIIITTVEFVTEKLMISDYMTRDRNGAMNKIIQNVIMSIFLAISVVPMIIFTRYSEAE